MNKHDVAKFLDYFDPTPENAAIAQRYINKFHQHPEVLDNAMHWIRANVSKFEGNPERAISHFQTHMEQCGVAAEHISACLDLRTEIVQRGLSDSPAPDKQAVRDDNARREPSSDAAARLAEIRAARRADPQAYDSNHEVQREELALLEGKPWPPTHQYPSDIRRAEIRATRRADPTAFDGDRAVEAEEIGLIGMDVPGRSSSPSAPAAPSAPAPGGTSAID